MIFVILFNIIFGTFWSSILKDEKRSNNYTNSPNRVISAGYKLAFEHKGIDLEKIQRHVEDLDITYSELIDSSLLASRISFNSPEGCLKLFFETKLTRSSYQVHNVIKRGLKKLFCIYKKIQAEKLKCIPRTLEV